MMNVTNLFNFKPQFSLNFSPSSHSFHSEFFSLLTDMQLCNTKTNYFWKTATAVAHMLSKILFNKKKRFQPINYVCRGKEQYS
jgi:hypothetical protein